MKVEERFLKYVSYWTTSCDGQEQIPSTDRQFELGHALADELRELGLSRVKCDEHCYVYGLLPATEGYEDKKSIGFIAHMDTAPDFSGKDVHPTLIPDYDGKDVTLQATGGYLVPMLIFASFGVLAFFLTFMLKIEDRKKGYGLEEPNVKK